jgi:pimeloyl-ACP methyl ester carboxylesterase
MTPVAFLGGNGHCAARLADARRFAAGLELIDVAYPGFEGRPRARELEGFLDHVARGLRAPALVYATGIGGLLALCLRARRALDGTPLLLQAPVLWGLERRLMPRLMRLWPAQRLVHRVFASPAFQARFLRKHFQRPPSSDRRAAFFDGYASCAALPDMFAWLAPALLRRLEVELNGCPGTLERITVWWGGKDRVVATDELRWTRAALGVDWPLRVFPQWGHYPMIDEPEAWVAEIRAFLSDPPDSDSLGRE